MTHEQNNDSSALAIRPSAQERVLDRLAFEPQNFDEAFKVGTMLVASKLLPTTVDTPQKCVTIMMRGRELGLSVMQSMSMIYVIEGKAVMSADLMAALVITSKECVSFEMVESTSTRCTYATQRVKSKRETSITWTIEDAKQAGLLNKQNWQKYPAAMLSARCKAALARAVYPDIVAGIYDPDEMEPVIDVVPMSVRERRDQAIKDLIGFETLMTEQGVYTVTGTSRRELERQGTIEDLEKAVAQLRRAQDVRTGAINAHPITKEEATPLKVVPQEKAAQVEPAQSTTKVVETKAVEPKPADKPASGPAQAATDDEDTSERALMKAARLAGVRLVDVSRSLCDGKNPDKLSDDERRTVLAHLRTLEKGGK